MKKLMDTHLDWEELAKPMGEAFADGTQSGAVSLPVRTAHIRCSLQSQVVKGVSPGMGTLSAQLPQAVEHDCEC